MKQSPSTLSFRIKLDVIIGAYLGTTGAIGTACITSGQFPSWKIVLAAVLLSGIPQGCKTLQSRLALAPGQTDASDPNDAGATLAVASVDGGVVASVQTGASGKDTNA